MGMIKLGSWRILLVSSDSEQGGLPQVKAAALAEARPCQRFQKSGSQTLISQGKHTFVHFIPKKLPQNLAKRVSRHDFLFILRYLLRFTASSVWSVEDIINAL